MFNTPPSNCCAYAEKKIRSVDPDEVRSLLIEHLADEEISAREIQAFLTGVRGGAHAGYEDARRIYGATATTLAAMYSLLLEAKTSIDDIPALEVFAKATKLYEDEVRQQRRAHEGLYAIIVESSWQVPVGFLQPGVDPDEEYLAQIGIDFATRNPAFAMELNRIGVDRFRQEIANPRPISDQLQNPPPTIEREQPIAMEELGQFALTQARTEFNAYLEKGMDVFSPQEHGADVEDVMARLMKRAAT